MLRSTIRQEVFSGEILSNQTYRQNLENRLAVETVRARELQEAIQESDGLFFLWNLVRDARCDYYDVTVRRQALKRLRDLAGEEAYSSGHLPPYVPLCASRQSTERETSKLSATWRPFMKDGEQLRQIVEDLIGIMHLQTKEVEALLGRVEQVAGHLGDKHQLSVVASELSELHVRVKSLGRLTEPPANPDKHS